MRKNEKFGLLGRTYIHINKLRVKMIRLRVKFTDIRVDF
jgi:hypothetical protein